MAELIKYLQLSEAEMADVINDYEFDIAFALKRDYQPTDKNKARSIRAEPLKEIYFDRFFDIVEGKANMPRQRLVPYGLIGHVLRHTISTQVWDAVLQQSHMHCDILTLKTCLCVRIHCTKLSKSLLQVHSSKNAVESMIQQSNYRPAADFRSK